MGRRIDGRRETKSTGKSKDRQSARIELSPVKRDSPVGGTGASPIKSDFRLAQTSLHPPAADLIIIGH